MLDLEKYTWTDGKTPLSAVQLNQRFYALVRRLHSLESLSVSWGAAVAELRNYGLERINDAVSPLLDGLRCDLDELVAQGRSALGVQEASVEEFLARGEASISSQVASVEELLARGEASISSQVASVEELLARGYAALRERSISIRDFGVAADGVADDTGVWSDFVERVHDERVAGFIPPGIYRITARKVLTLSAPLYLKLAQGAKIIADFPGDGGILEVRGTTGQSLHIDGGYWDGDRLSSAWKNGFFGCTYCDHVTIENATFKTGVSATDGVGDGHIFVVGNHSTITGNTFIGSCDNSVYLSGSADETDSNHHVVTNNAFYHCGAAVISKRQGERAIVTNNYFEHCGVGVATGGADATLLPGKKLVVIGNTFKKCAKAVDVCISDYSIISGNQIIDYGHASDGTPVAAGVGIKVSGSRHCVVSGNIIALEEYPQPSIGGVGIGILPTIYNGVTYTSDHNLVQGNIINVCRVGVFEEDGAEGNRCIGNHITNAMSSYEVTASAQIIDTTADEISFWQGGAVRVRIKNDALMIGTSDGLISTPGITAIPSGLLRIVRSGDVGCQLVRLTSDGIVAQFIRNASAVGSISVTGSATAYATSSDARLKSVIGEITDGVARLQALRPVYFRWLADGETGPVVDGFIAQELKTQIPHAVCGDESDADEDGNPIYMGIDQSKLTPLLVAAVKDLAIRVAALESKD